MQERRPQRFPDKSAAELSLLRNGSWSSPRRNAEAPARAEELGRVCGVADPPQDQCQLPRTDCLATPATFRRVPCFHREGRFRLTCHQAPSRTRLRRKSLPFISNRPARQIFLLGGNLCSTSRRSRCWTRRESESFWTRTRRSYCIRRKFSGRLARGTLQGTGNHARE